MFQVNGVVREQMDIFWGGGGETSLQTTPIPDWSARFKMKAGLSVATQVLKSESDM